MKMISCCCLFLLYCMPGLNAQSLRYPAAAPNAGLLAYSIEQYGPFAFTGNQAILARLKQASIALSGERRYMLKELADYRLGIALPTRLGNVGLILRRSGSANFSEQGMGLAYGKALGKKISLGIQLNYYSYRIPDYAGAGTFYGEAGALIRLSDRLTGGLHCYNPAGGKLGKGSVEKLPVAWKMGLGYDASPTVFTGIEIMKEENRELAVSAMFQYNCSKKLVLHAGINTNAATFFGGAAWAVSKMQLQLSVSYHRQLGISPGLTIGYYFKQKEK